MKQFKRGENGGEYDTYGGIEESDGMLLGRTQGQASSTRGMSGRHKLEIRATRASASINKFPKKEPLVLGQKMKHWIISQVKEGTL